MKDILVMIVVCILVVLLEGCIVLSLKLDENGFSAGVQADVPEIDYSKVIGD